MPTSCPILAPASANETPEISVIPVSLTALPVSAVPTIPPPALTSVPSVEITVSPAWYITLPLPSFAAMPPKAPVFASEESAFFIFAVVLLTTRAVGLFVPPTIAIIPDLNKALEVSAHSAQTVIFSSLTLVARFSAPSTVPITPPYALRYGTLLDSSLESGLGAEFRTDWSPVFTLPASSARLVIDSNNPELSDSFVVLSLSSVSDELSFSDKV